MFRSLLESAPDGIVVVDATGHIVIVNGQAERMFGYAREELLGQQVEILVPEQARRAHVPHRREYADAPRTRPMGAGRLLTARRRDGTEFPVEISLSPLDTADGLLVTSIIRDVTERRRAEEQLRQAERLADEERVRSAQAQEALRLRDEFLSIASHELKTPLTVLQLQLQSLTERLAALDASVVAKATRALRNTDRLVHLVESLLDVSRIAAGRMQLEPERIALNDLVADVADRLREQAAGAGCDIRLELGEPVEGEWDRLRLEQAITNLLSNAFKYGRSRPVRLVTRRTGAAAEIAVIDGGPGVEPESATRIFERFERAASVRHYGGLGLGLYITREIVAAHHGSVALESRAGAGAAFVIRLPLAAAAEASAPPARDVR